MLVFSTLIGINMDYPYRLSVRWDLKASPNDSVSQSHRPSPKSGTVILYDVTKPYSGNFRCIKTKTRPSTTVCLYSALQDIYISHDLETTGMWEPHVVADFLEVLRRDDAAAVIDIGANIGFYTLLAAKIGRRVIAVEPLVDSIYRIHRAAQMENVADRISVVHNAVADVRMIATIRRTGDNQGDTRIELNYEPCIGACPPAVNTILLDDLLEIIQFQRAVMKIDIQGYENRVFRQATTLFDKIDITYVFMEWILMKEHYIRANHTSSERSGVEETMRFFFHRDYRPYSLSASGAKALDPDSWYTWPDDVVWQKLPNVEIETEIVRNHFRNWPP